MRQIMKILLGVVAVLTLAVPAANAAVQDVQVTLDQENARVEGLDGYGWAMLTLSAPRDVYYAVVRLHPGKDTTAFANKVPNGLSPTAMESWGTTIAGGSARKGLPYRTTVDLTPGWYGIVVYEGEGKKAKQYTAGGFTVRDVLAAGPPTEPPTAATIGLRDFRFTGPTTLPATGGLKIVNEGDQLHELVIAKVRGRMADAIRTAKTGKFGKLKLAGPPTQLIGIVSGGTTNIVEPKLSPGQYLMLCAYGDKHSRNKPHAALGMVQSITVR
jgi:hypothetical protein